MWCIPDLTPEFITRMYDILDLYELPYDPKNPVIGVDEKPIQLLDHSRTPIPTKAGKIAKEDYEYKRNGTANVFMGVEFKAGKRITQVTKRRTKGDYAKYMRKLALRYIKVDKIHIVQDNLNTHFENSFTENFSTNVAQQLLNKLEFHFTPKHASWLNVAETEIGVMDTECTGRRMENLDFLKQEVNAWTKKRNILKKKINWKFTKKDAKNKFFSEKK